MRSKTRKPNPFLPLQVSAAINFFGTGYVMLWAHQAYTNFQCTLGAPWDSLDATHILQNYYPAALRETKTLRQLSSQCIAALHAQTTSAYITIYGIALALGLVAFLFTKLQSASKLNLTKKTYLRAVLATFLLSFLCAYTTFIVFYYQEIIIFEGKRGRFSVKFYQDYVSVLNYWLSFQLFSLIGILGLWFGCLGIAAGWRSVFRAEQLFGNGKLSSGDS
ncbi:hypothetical protein AB4072_00150 [Microvirga sp. 2MCAF38]|uniref:hypothetical protein n=1 Tax=Microvirga sp. 2MCAF38 TaxID=3232989 RepID=UPI003F9CFA5E